MLMALASNTVFAESSTIEADEVFVVTGTKTEKLLSDTPVRTEVVTAEQLASMHATDLKQALEQVPGVTLTPVHGKQGGYEISMQGFGGNRVLVLIDGMPISPSTGSTTDLSQYGIVNIKQIEIVRGSVSALHGSEAMGGVINVITHTPEHGFGSELTLQGGSYDQYDQADTLPNNANVRAKGHIASDWGFAMVAVDHRDFGGSDMRSDVPGYDNFSGTKTNLSTTLAIEFDNGGLLSINPSYYKEDRERIYAVQGTSIPWVRKLETGLATREHLNVRYRGNIAEDIYLSSYVMMEEYDEKTTLGATDKSSFETKRHAIQELNKAEAQIDFPLGDKHLVTLGAVGLYNSLQQFKNGVSELKSDKEDRSSVEFFLQDDFFINDQLELLTGFRAQEDSDFGFHFAPKINVMYTPTALADNDVKVRSGFGYGYRVPNLKERHFIFDHSNLGYMVLGNSELKPETSRSLQLGVESTFFDYLTGDINLYHHDTEKLIGTDFSHTQQGVAIYKYKNFNETKQSGLDAHLRFKRVGDFSGSLSWSYLNAKISDTSKYIPKYPKSQAKLNVNYHLDALATELSLFARFEGESYADSGNTRISPSHAVYNLKANTWIGEHVKVFGGIDNLTDETKDFAKADSDVRPSTGRFIYLGLTVKY